MIVIRIDHGSELDAYEKRELGRAYGAEFDSAPELGLVIGCNANGQWDNHERCAVPGYYVFVLGAAPEPTTNDFDRWAKTQPILQTRRWHVVHHGRKAKPRRPKKTVRSWG